MPSEFVATLGLTCRWSKETKSPWQVLCCQSVSVIHMFDGQPFSPVTAPLRRSLSLVTVSVFFVLTRHLVPNLAFLCSVTKGRQCVYWSFCKSPRLRVSLQLFLISTQEWIASALTLPVFVQNFSRLVPCAMVVGMSQQVVTQRCFSPAPCRQWCGAFLVGLIGLRVGKFSAIPDSSHCNSHPWPLQLENRNLIASSRLVFHSCQVRFAVPWLPGWWPMGARLQAI